MKTKYLAAAVLVGVLLSSTTSAATIGIFNTGVDSSGNAWAGAGVPDIHYSVITSPLGAFIPVTVDTSPSFPIPPWVANNAFSRWIGTPSNFSEGPGGFYTYRTTFNLPSNAILSTATISGLWGTDDPGLDILINGNSTGQLSAGFTSLVPFSINSGFVIGLNTVDFILQNAFGPTGLRIDQVKGSYQIPEPAGIALLGGSFAWLLGRRRH